MTATAVGGAGHRLRRAALVATAAVAVAGGLPATAATARAAPGQQWKDVVVTGSTATAAAAAVTGAGGQVLASLPVTRGVAARLPVGAALGADWVVAPQRQLRVATATTDTAATADAAAATDGTVRQTLGLPADGDEGRGVTVAVLDTGIADVPDLSGKIIDRVDVTGTGAGDGYGHGTFMAGLIAGSGVASGGTYRGVAPAANLIDVKVADSDGRTDLITVLLGLQWVNDHANKIGVLNLSLSSYSPLPYQVDPLAQSLEELWRRGVVVVVPSGNDGPEAGTVTSPGSDPVLLTAGGLDSAGTAARGDDSVGQWSGRGPTWQGDAKPDLAAPGARVISLRSPGSVVDTVNPRARIGEHYFRGSGTSMAAAVTSGVVAGVLAEAPRLRPDSVKNLLAGTAYQAQGLGTPSAAGAGGLDATRALSSAPGWRTDPAEVQHAADAAAVGRDAKRWAAFEQAVLDGDPAGAEAAWGKLSAASRDWAARAWADLDPAARAWAARAWAARTWAGAGDQWAARAWAARAWAARAWAGDQWAARTWAARTWAGDDWTARAWADLDPAARAWAARAWAARTWAGDDWAARTWAEQRWSARGWAWLPFT